MKTIGLVAKIAAAVCPLVVFPVHADRWNFVFHDLHHVYFYSDGRTSQTIDYGYESINGFFIADDLNHDGHINLAEVQMVGVRFSLYEKVYGEIDSFSYSGGNALSFVAYGSRNVVSTSLGLFYSSGCCDDNYSVNARSYITVNAAPVPEASSFASLAAGLLGLSGFAAFRRRASMEQAGASRDCGG